MSQTSESESSQKIVNGIRNTAIIVLVIHFYFASRSAFAEWGVGGNLVNQVSGAIDKSSQMAQFYFSKIIALLCLGLSLMGARGKKEPGLTQEAAFGKLIAGLVLYFASGLVFLFDETSAPAAVVYMVMTLAGFLLVLHGGTLLSRVIRNRQKADIFNRRSQGFPQEEQLIRSKYSIHLPAEYELNDEIRPSMINISNPFRGTLVLGSPGSGKTWFVIQRFIKQQIQMGFSMLVYDFKYPALSKIAYNYFLAFKDRYPGQPAHYHINFADLSRSHRCNPLAPATLPELSDAIESARSILLGLNPEGTSKQGDFWLESSVNFVTCIIWYLRQYSGGKYCTWAHVIELAGRSYKDLFSILRTEPEIQTLVQPFVDAFIQGNTEQLGGQAASANIGLGRLSTPAMVYVLTGDDFTLDLNNPDFPKVLTLANSPQTSTTYGAFLSVFINTINRLAAKEGMNPLGQVIDEASTVTATSLSQSIAQGRSYKIAITLAVQDASQLKLVYGNKYADVLMNLCGNVISGQVTGETARWLSERFGKTMQERESLSINASDTSITRSQQLEQVIPPSRLASLSSGEFAGLIGDNPDQPAGLKMFCARILNNVEALDREESRYADLPIVRDVTPEMVRENYLRVKSEIARLINVERNRMEKSPELRQYLL